MYNSPQVYPGCRPEVRSEPLAECMSTVRVDDIVPATSPKTLVTRYGKRAGDAVTTVIVPPSSTSMTTSEDPTTTVFVTGPASTTSEAAQSTTTVSITSSATNPSKPSSTTTIFITPSSSTSTSTPSNPASTTTLTAPPTLTTSTSTSSSPIPSFYRQSLITDSCPPTHSKRCRFLPNAPLWPAGGKECYCIQNALSPPLPSRPAWDTSDFEKQGVQVKMIPEPTQLELDKDGKYDTSVGSKWWMWVDRDEDGREDPWRGDVGDD
ncbi:hypothetical protein Slin14017_G063010 [Septoria linicola]|nr:hypothetical protein Slin14017_G063010 [Septoria linicola]